MTRRCASCCCMLSESKTNGRQCRKNRECRHLLSRTPLKSFDRKRRDIKILCYRTKIASNVYRQRRSRRRKGRRKFPRMFSKEYRFSFHRAVEQTPHQHRGSGLFIQSVGSHIKHMNKQSSGAPHKVCLCGLSAARMHMMIVHDDARCRPLSQQAMTQ